METTYEKYSEFSTAAEAYLIRIGNKKTVLAQHIRNVMESARKPLAKYNKTLDSYRANFAKCDDEGVLVVNEGKNGEDRYNFTSAKMVAMSEKLYELSQQKINIKSSFSPLVPKSLSLFQIEAMRGFVISPEFKIDYEEEEGYEVVNTTPSELEEKEEKEEKEAE